MPDSYCDLFFLQTTDLTLIGPLFRETPETTKLSPVNANLVQRVPLSFFKGNLQNPSDFFRHSATFFEKFLKSPKGPFKFFDILQKNVC